jgi:hypothetical protein
LPYLDFLSIRPPHRDYLHCCAAPSKHHLQNIALAFSDGPKAVFAIFAAGVLSDRHRAFEKSGTVEADAPIT